MTTTAARIVAGLIIAVGLTVGATPVAAAEAGTRGDSTTDTRTSNTRTSDSKTGLNGNLPGRAGAGASLNQFGHLPFNPAMPGGD